MSENVRKLMEALGVIADVADEIRPRAPLTAKRLDKIQDAILRAMPVVRGAEKDALAREAARV